ncbi:nucleoside-diphosphate sugar epimerase/dehydratase [Thermodesulfovibrio sp. 3907-1M]|uniref:Nucleoside-diphosphate sugar epimerase/dehydratase n=1 Tax=Thermodesulfovibrio autotrophicus TaxID=3118333 RepID=A0AAU8GWL9_9BACT
MSQLLSFHYISLFYFVLILLCPPKYTEIFFICVSFFVFVKIFCLWLFKVYKIPWRYFSLADIPKLLNSLTTASLIIFLSVFLLRNYQYLLFLPQKFIQLSSIPVSVVFIDCFISFICISFLRISKRFYFEIFKGKRFKEGFRTLIIGAGNVGEMILRDIKRQNFSGFCPVGFLDDDKRKIGTYIQNLKVYDSIDNLGKVIKNLEIEAIIIAIPSLSHKKLIDIYISAKNAGVSTIKIIPKLYQFEKPEINLKKLEDIKIEDLLGRQEVNINFEEVKSFLQNKKILITGAGGSIGSELVIQTAQFAPKETILLDIDETELFNMEVKLNKFFPELKSFKFIVADIRDHMKLDQIFKKIKPDIVFHAAAYKHVPMMEYNADEAVKVNIFGTYYLANIAGKYNVEKFILISTDKAVSPISVMGMTKRVAEYICKALNEYGKTDFISVRFGNVLGSRGSILPLWMEQIKNGGPITVTHKDMQRYFMTIPEAVLLVLQASAIGKCGEILVLDMGEPVKIIDLAERFIKLHGFEPYKDIDIKFIGIRPGENLFENILTSEEGVTATKNERVFIAKEDNRLSFDYIESFLKKLEEIIRNESDEKNMKIKQTLSEFINSCKKGK